MRKLMRKMRVRNEEAETQNKVICAAEGTRMSGKCKWTENECERKEEGELSLMALYFINYII